MDLQTRTKKELLAELSELRQRISALETLKREHERAGSALQKTYSELEQRVEEHTDELLKVNEQLKREIDERKRAEDDLRKGRERLSIILDGNPIPTFVIDQEHRVMLWNRACESLTRVPREEVLGKPLDPQVFYKGQKTPVLADLVLEMDMRGMRRYYGDKNLSESAVIPEAFEASDQLTIGGVQRMVYFLAARLRDSLGNVIGAVETLQDITEKEQLQKQLQHAQKMEALGTLAGGVAHEFNNILAAIQGHAQLSLMKLGPEHPVSEYLSDIQASCHRAAALIRKMLTFSRLDVGERVPVKVNRVVDGVQQLLRQTLPPQIELDSELQSSLPLVMAEPPQLEQVLLNLGVNARDAMPNGGKIRFRTLLVDLDDAFCRAHRWAKPGRYIETSVEDIGEGMPPEVLERIFEPFFTTKEPDKGTGLGLSIAYSIVKNHGGYILAESEPGQGSLFRIYLPSLEDERTEGENLLDAEEEEALPTGRGESVLVVDDELQIREIAREMLSSYGYRVSLAADGQEALGLYRQAMNERNSFDVVIMDLAMPVMGGEDCLERILKMDPDARVLISTGYGSEQMSSPLVKPKAKGILLKPFNLRVLLCELRNILDTREEVP